MSVMVGMLCTVLLLAGPVAAGELVFANGGRIEADLANDVLVLSTGSALVEVSPETVALMTPVEIRLKDGRVLRGTLVGDRLKARTALGELAIKVEELGSFRATGPVAAPGAPVVAAPAPPAAPTPEAPAAPDAGLPPVALYQHTLTTPEPPQTAAVAPTPADGVPAPTATDSKRLEVVTEQSALYRNALSAGSAVGRVTRGETVTYVDSIDRRLRIYNTVIFDGGHWIKVRAADGTEGWLPASTLREAR